MVCTCCGRNESLTSWCTCEIELCEQCAALCVCMLSAQSDIQSFFERCSLCLLYPIRKWSTKEKTIKKRKWPRRKNLLRQVLRLLRHLRLLHCLACAMKLCWDVRNYPLMLSLKPGIKSRLNFTKISSRTFNSKYAGQIYLQTHQRTHSKLCPDLCRHPGPWLVKLQILTLGEVLVLTIFLLALDSLYDYSYVFEAYAIRLRDYNLAFVGMSETILWCFRWSLE